MKPRAPAMQKSGADSEIGRAEFVNLFRANIIAAFQQRPNTAPRRQIFRAAYVTFKPNPHL